MRMATPEEVQQFIKDIASIVQKCAKEKGYKVASPVIAQACLESGYGTSYKAQFHNYFGMKYRPNRCPSSNGYFYDKTLDQDDSGNIIKATDNWFAFETMEDGVRGFYEFISVSIYDSLREHDITTPEEWLIKIVQCGYATKFGYIDKNMILVNKYNLRDYDNIFIEQKDDTSDQQDVEPESNSFPKAGITMDLRYPYK